MIISIKEAYHGFAENLAKYSVDPSWMRLSAYAQSKLANLLFTLELNQQFKEINADAMAVAAHPGWTVQVFRAEEIPIP